ncbi:MAG TPA: protein kinase [Thermoanaerobaculia bacterium]|jgi:TolB-like protein/tRNA A-37 threonylcarbamoyl transferase component Bud32/Tfp pilus assembly protein PilF
MTLSSGSRLGPYELLSPLGKGGMGEVYRAKDTRVDRAVALKVLPEEFFESEERRGRFEREARMLASLNHPGIAALYSFEEIPSSSSSSSSRHLLVMELVEGDDLARKISAGPLSLEEILSFARQIAEALEAAHGKGIVHRDLKPANVRVTPDGRVKLLDFGLAKRAGAGPSGSEDATATAGLSEAGAVMGTIPYMSPEQVSGRPLDARTDLFSLGVVLYEMACGRRPFEGDSSAELASAILRDTPPPVGRVRTDLPEDLAEAIRRCLEKDPRNRFPSARDLLAAFDMPRRSAPAPVSIAVLPFVDMSSAKDQEYLCEGMAEEIMNALVGAGIRVAARMSTFRAARQGDDLAAVARVLSVGHVLDGSVRTAGPRIRVTARLTDAATGFQVWSEKFDRELADVFAVQDEIAAGVVEAVRSRLGAEPAALQARRQVRNLEAYQHYLMGRHLRFTKNDHGSALLSFERAVALDPSHGPSWVGLADIHVLAAAYGMRPSAEANAAAKVELATAERLQGETGDACYVEGMIAFGERRWADADRAMARAIRIEPGNVQAQCWRAMLHSNRGRTEAAIEALERAREIDPVAPYPYAMTGFCLLNLRRASDAARFAGQALAFDEDNLLALWVAGAADVSGGRADQAVSRLERAAERARTNSFTQGTLGWALASAGRIGDARRVLEALHAGAVPGATVLSEAWLLAALGDADAAFEVLQRACDEKQLLVPFIGLPGLDLLRFDPRFAAFVERLGLPPSAVAP